MPRKVIITESQLNLITEAAKDTFSYKELSLLPFEERGNYCREKLGRYIGYGSSRVVFQIDDYRVLKLAIDITGIEQNKYEGRESEEKYKYNIFPVVYGHADDWSWLVSEYVIPAKKEDFKEILGFSFDYWQGILLKIAEYVKDDYYEQHNIVNAMIGNSELAKETYKYFKENPQETISDLFNINNYGMAKRGSNVSIVILDSGLSEEIKQKYYGD